MSSGHPVLLPGEPTTLGGGHERGPPGKAFPALASELTSSSPRTLPLAPGFQPPEPADPAWAQSPKCMARGTPVPTNPSQRLSGVTTHASSPGHPLDPDSRAGPPRPVSPRPVPPSRERTGRSDSWLRRRRKRCVGATTAAGRLSS